MERSKKIKNSFLIAHRDWIGSENIFWERFKCAALNKNDGISPSRLFELRSIKGKLEISNEKFGIWPLIWLLDKSKNCSYGEKSQQKWKMLSEIPELEILSQ